MAGGVFVQEREKHVLFSTSPRPVSLDQYYSLERKQTILKACLLQIFNITRKSGLCPLTKKKHKKKKIDVIYCLYKMKKTQWLGIRSKEFEIGSEKSHHCQFKNLNQAPLVVE